MAEGEAERGGDDHGLDMRFGDPGASENIGTEVSIEAGMVRDLAPVMMGAPGNRGFPKGLGPAPPAATSTVKPPLEKPNAPTWVASSPRAWATHRACSPPAWKLGGTAPQLKDLTLHRRFRRRG